MPRSTNPSTLLRIPRLRVPQISLLRFGIAATCLLLALSGSLLAAQSTLKTPAQAPPAQKPAPLTVDRDPVRSPDLDEVAKPATSDVTKDNRGYTIVSNVEEVSLNVTVLDSGGHIAQNLKEDDFRVLEDGIQQKLLSFQHARESKPQPRDCLFQ